MAVGGKKFLNAAWHGYAAREFGVVPFKVYVSKFGNLKVLSDGIVILEDISEGKGMAFVDVFNAKVISNEGE